MGLGGGGVLLIYLTVFAETPQLKAQGINLLFFLPVGLIAIIIYSFKHLIKWKTVLKMWLGGVLGVGLGVLLAKTIETDFLKEIFAAFLIAFGSWQLFAKRKNNHKHLSR